MNLVFRELQMSDRDAALTAHRELAPEGFGFLFGQPEELEWSDYLVDQASRSASWVPNAFLVAEVDGVLAGRVSVRFELNAFLATRGGHIGYGVRPNFRGRGLATAMLRHGLALEREHGVTEILMICDDTNLASASVIERCGGVLESVEPAGEDYAAFRRYWINR